MTFVEILRQAQSLSHDERKQLAILLIEGLDNVSQKPYTLLDFAGIAADFADEEDPQDYINRIRQEWNNRP